VAGLERRLGEAARLGFRRAIVPSGARGVAGARGAGLDVLEAATVREAIGLALVPGRRPGGGGGGDVEPEDGPVAAAQPAMLG
jgi:DNA repair protein RadA/Sms